MSPPKVDPAQVAEVLKGEFDAYVQAAVNDAPDGQWIAGSEEQVRDLSADFRRTVFQKAVQQRIDAAEAAFPPPTQTIIDPMTKQPATKRQKNKGRQKTHVLTVNGRIRLQRRWWHSQTQGSWAPGDDLFNRQGQTVTVGVIEMAARLNNDGTSFDSAAENLTRTAQVKMSGEQLRKLVIQAGKDVIDGQRLDEIPTAFQADQCQADPANPSGPSRISLGVDGVMVPAITDSEKIKRRETIKRKRQRSGKKCWRPPIRYELPLG